MSKTDLTRDQQQISHQAQQDEMSGIKDLSPDLDKLEGQLDDLEDALQPLLDNLEEMASQVPLLDKAKLFSLTAYSIESLLFCEMKWTQDSAGPALTPSSIVEASRNRRAEPRRLHGTQARPAVFRQDQGHRAAGARGPKDPDGEPGSRGAGPEGRLGEHHSVQSLHACEMC